MDVGHFWSCEHSLYQCRRVGRTARGPVSPTSCTRSGAWVGRAERGAGVTYCMAGLDSRSPASHHTPHRAGASPGVIDGRFGSNDDKALVAYRELTGENLKSTDAD